ncbi:IS66 family transposase [Bacillota bacterium LCP21S3_D9]
MHYFVTSIPPYLPSLNTVEAVSINRTSKILHGLFGIPITPATITSMVRNCAGKTSAAMEKIRAGLIESNQHHADETRFRTEGSLHLVHVLCNRMYTYLTISKKRQLMNSKVTSKSHR